MFSDILIQILPHIILFRCNCNYNFHSIMLLILTPGLTLSLKIRCTVYENFCAVHHTQSFTDNSKCHWQCFAKWLPMEGTAYSWCFTVSVVQDCLHQLMYVVNFLFSGTTHQHNIAPWFCGVPITTLHKKNGGVYPVAVCETLRQLVRWVCCLVVCKDQPDLFNPVVRWELESKEDSKQLFTPFVII